MLSLIIDMGNGIIKAMKILVCIKQVPDTNSLISIDSSGKWIDESKSTFRMNRYDEHAMEEALKIKDSNPKTVVDTLTIGPQRSAAVVRRTLEMGADEGFHIVAPSGLIEPRITASLIADHINKNFYNLILCGQMAEDDMLSQIGPITAAILGIPSSTSVVDIKTDTDNSSVIIERDLSSGKRQKINVSLPCLLAVQSGINRPRYPSLSNVLRAKKQLIKTFDPIITTDSRDSYTISHPEKSASGNFIEGNTREKATKLVQILHDNSII